MHSFFVVPTGYGAGLTSVCFGLVRALDQQGIRVGFCKPIAQHKGGSGQDPSFEFAKTIQHLSPPTPIPLEYAQAKLASGDVDDLLEEIVNLCQQAFESVDVLIVEGLVPQENSPFTARLNLQIANSLDSDVILVSAKNALTEDELNHQISFSRDFYGSGTRDVLGCILNKVGAPSEEQEAIAPLDSGEVSLIDTQTDLMALPVFSKGKLPCLGQIKFNPILLAPRMQDIFNLLNSEQINEQGDLSRRVLGISVCARSIPNMLNTLQAGSLIVTPGDRDDILLVSCMAALNGIPLAGIILTGGYIPEKPLLDLCQAAFETGLPIVSVSTNTYRTAQLLSQLNSDVPSDDLSRMENVINAVSDELDINSLAQHAKIERQARLSPAAFRHNLVRSATSQMKTIVLPEGEEPRTIAAAIQCANKRIANCILLGDVAVINRVVESLNLTLPANVEIKQPKNILENYVKPLTELRKNKNLTEQAAREMLEDPVVVGTMMLAINEVDGLVSGAVNTTANTIRPALQLIKTKPGAALVSSLFFMCLPEQVLVFADCAVNPDPNAQELADIAIQTGDSAKAFGIEPKVAMISYSTGESGFGCDVDKVRQAVNIVKQQRPDIVIDGPLQYDAATVKNVAEKKAPHSPVAGQATVLIFPDLNTGNTTYKAVQRSANVISIGPMLQGLKKPVNDLSRGALVEDIVFTIALTAIQAQNV